MVRAVLFDLGGTLMSFGDPDITFRELNAIGLRGLHDYLVESGYRSLPSWSDFYEYLDLIFEDTWVRSRATLQSTSLDQIIPAALARWGIHVPDEMIEEAYRRFHAPMQPYIRLYDDTLWTLQALAQRGLRFGLISNTIWRPEMHDADLARSSILHLLPLRLYSSVLPYVKPHHAIFQQALAALGAQPDETLFVGDRLWDDVGGAQRAGIRGVLKIVPERVEADERVTPDHQIHALAELLELI